MMTARITWVLGCLVFTMLPGSVRGQEKSPVHPWRLEVQPVYGTLVRTYESRSARVGPELGVGIMELVASRVDGDPWQPVLHVGARVERSVGRVIPSGHFMMGYAATPDCGASDCWPDPFWGAAFGLTRMGDRFSLGTRVYLVQQSSRTLLGWSPLILGIGFGRRPGS